MLSICVTSKNRHALFARCLRQLLACNVRGCELVVADWGSTDCDMASWLRREVQHAPIDLTTVQLPADMRFSRGMGLNHAASVAQHDRLFFIDTDMLIPQTVLDNAVMALDSGFAYFPICWSYTNAQHTAGRWRVNGKGISAVTKKVYHDAGRWPEIHQWGSEDRMFFDAVAKLVPITRQNEKGLFHQWHEPSSTPRRPSRPSSGKS